MLMGNFNPRSFNSQRGAPLVELLLMIAGFILVAVVVMQSIETMQGGSDKSSLQLGALSAAMERNKDKIIEMKELHPPQIAADALDMIANIENQTLKTSSANYVEFGVVKAGVVELTTDASCNGEFVKHANRVASDIAQHALVGVVGKDTNCAADVQGEKLEFTALVLNPTIVSELDDPADPGNDGGDCACYIEPLNPGTQKGCPTQAPFYDAGTDGCFDALECVDVHVVEDVQENCGEGLPLCETTNCADPCNGCCHDGSSYKDDGSGQCVAGACTATCTPDNLAGGMAAFSVVAHCAVPACATTVLCEGPIETPAEYWSCCCSDPALPECISYCAIPANIGTCTACA